jgi:SAM-dependent methyltransferase
MIILNIILIVFLLFVIAVIFLNAFYFFWLAVPSLSSNNKVLAKVLENIDFQGKKKFYDLGCGNGSFIAKIAKNHPALQCIGIECNLGIYWWAILRNIFAQQKIVYLRKNFFKINLADADVIFVYLFPAFMEPLNAKFKQELKKGALVVSNSFPIKTKAPLKIIPGEKGALETLYIYEY